MQRITSRFSWSYLFALAACYSQPTSALLRVEPVDDLELVRVEIRDSDDTFTSETHVFSRSSWNSRDGLSFGVTRRQADAFLARATGLIGGRPVVRGQTLVRFVSEATVRAEVRLRPICSESDPCPVGLQCELPTQTCLLPGSSEPAADSGGTNGGTIVAKLGPMERSDGVSVEQNAGTAASSGSGGWGGNAAGGPSLLASGAGAGPRAGAGGVGVGVGIDAAVKAGSGAGNAGTAAPMPSGEPVRGTLLDELRRPMPKVKIAIGDQVATTDAQGHFAFAAVAATYDLRFTTPEWSQPGGTRLSIFQGLTRRDPIVQCRRCMQPRQTTNVAVRLIGYADGQYVQIAAGGSDVLGSLAPTASSASWPLSWSGAARTTSVMHALSFHWDATAKSVSDFLSYETQTVELGTGADTVTFALPRTALRTFQVEGNVVAPGKLYRLNYVFIRWDDGATISHLVSENAKEHFAYTVPALPNARVALYALEGARDAAGQLTFPLAEAFIDDLTETQLGLTLTLPSPAGLLSPAAGERVTPETAFEWSDSAHVFAWNAVAGLAHVTIVSGSRPLRVPSDIWGNALPRATPATWSVTSFPAFADVDAAAASGVLQSWVGSWVGGPAHGSDSRADSEVRMFTTPP